MQFKYIYKNKVTGQRLYTNEEVQGENWILISEYRDGSLKDSNKVIKK